MFIVTAKQDIGLELHADQEQWVHADHAFPSQGHEADAWGTMPLDLPLRVTPRMRVWVS